MKHREFQIDIIDNEEIYLNIAKKIHNKNDIFFIGRGIDYWVCLY